MSTLPKVLLIVIGASVAIAFAAHQSASRQSSPREPRYTVDGRMLRPSDYREWVWLSSGLGMSYRSGAATREDPPFDNVFATPASYRSFQETGHWPDKTVLLLEARASVSRESINQSGHFQGDLLAVEVHVRDEHRFPGQWAFFAFEGSAESGSLIPTTASCYSCHQQHGAVDTTFVQFYPTLLEIAKQKHTLLPGK